MATHCGILLVPLLLFAAAPARVDLARARAENNLEKRSKLATDAAVEALKRAREAYPKGEMDRTKAAVAEVLEGVELAESSIKDSGKDPRRSPKWFKRVEMELRELIRKIDAFSNEMNYADRPLLEKLRTRTLEVHDSLLTGLMEGKRK